MCRIARAVHDCIRATGQEDVMAEKSKQAKEPKKKPQKTMMEKRKEKREKEATKHEE